MGTSRTNPDIALMLDAGTGEKVSGLFTSSQDDTRKPTKVWGRGF